MHPLSSARLLLPLLAAGILPLAGCATDPILDEGQAPPSTGVVSGDVIVLVPLSDPAPIYLYLLPLDLTTGALGAPADVRVIPAQALGPGGVTLTGRAAPYTFPAVDPGAYIISGLLDVDGNYNLIIPGLNVATAGDVAGAYVGGGSDPAVLMVEEGAALTEINVLFLPPEDDTPTPEAAATPTPSATEVPGTPTPAA